MTFGRTARESHTTATDAAMLDITVRLDTSRWSTRKKNLVTRMIMSGVLDAGYKTCMVVSDIMESYGIPYRFRRNYDYGQPEYRAVENKYLKPEKLDDLKAVAVASLKIRRSTDGGLGYYDQQWLDFAEGAEDSRRGYRPVLNAEHFTSYTPVHRNFPLEQYIVEDNGRFDDAKKQLCEQIANGEIIQAKYSPHKEAA